MNEDKNSVLKTAASFELIFLVAESLYMEAVWPSGKSAGLAIRRLRVQVPL